MVASQLAYANSCRPFIEAAAAASYSACCCAAVRSERGMAGCWFDSCESRPLEHSGQTDIFPSLVNLDVVEHEGTAALIDLLASSEAQCCLHLVHVADCSMSLASVL